MNPATFFCIAVFMLLFVIQKNASELTTLQGSSGEAPYAYLMSKRSMLFAGFRYEVAALIPGQLLSFKHQRIAKLCRRLQIHGKLASKRLEFL